MLDYHRSSDQLGLRHVQPKQVRFVAFGHICYKIFGKRDLDSVVPSHMTSSNDTDPYFDTLTQCQSLLEQSDEAGMRRVGCP
ncbi:hypothetical protein BgiBS90_008387 [Biomphalaria glabrata]|nr:hypothetical protein BgiBS90_008387 [Biomphalaria glabrata]